MQKAVEQESAVVRALPTNLYVQVALQRAVEQESAAVRAREGETRDEPRLREIQPQTFQGWNRGQS